MGFREGGSGGTGGDGDPRFLASVTGWTVVPVTRRGIEGENTV